MATSIIHGQMYSYVLIKENNGAVSLIERESYHGVEISNESVEAYRSIALNDHKHMLQQNRIRNPLCKAIFETQLALSHTHSQLETRNVLLTNNGFTTEIVGDAENLDLQLVSKKICIAMYN